MQNGIHQVIQALSIEQEVGDDLRVHVLNVQVVYKKIKKKENENFSGMKCVIIVVKFALESLNGYH